MAIEKKFPRKLNNSVDSRLRRGDEMIDALNVQAGGDALSADEGGDAGVLKPVNGNTAIASTAAFETADRRIIGKVEDQKYRRVYLFVWCSNKALEGVYSYDSFLDSIFPVYTSTYFNFDQNGFVKGDVVHLTDNAETGDEKTYLYFTDNLNEPRRIDVSRIDVDQADYNEFDYVDFITACPTSPQKPITFQFSLDGESNVSNLESTNGFQFAYQNVYYSGEVSSPSVYSDIAVPPAYLQQGPLPLSDLFMENMITLTVPRNGYTREVEYIRVLVKYGNDNSFFIVDDFDPNYDSDTVVEFRNNRILSALTEAQSTQQFDALPRLAESQAVMEDRLFYGNYVENRDRVETNATLTVGYNQRPAELINYAIKVDEVILEVPTDGSLPTHQGPTPHSGEIRNRMSGLRLGFGDIPEVIEGGSFLNFELSFGPSKNWHLYNGYRSNTEGETIHGSKRVYVADAPGEYQYVKANASRSPRFRDSRRSMFGSAASTDNNVNSDGGTSPVATWVSQLGSGGTVQEAVYGTSALNPLIVKGSPGTISIALEVRDDVEASELRRVIVDIMSNRTDTNSELGYNLVTEDPAVDAKVLVLSKNTSYTYTYNLGLGDGDYINNTQLDARSGLIVAVGDKSVIDANDGRGVPPCGYFIINKATVQIKMEKMQEYQSNQTDSIAGFLVPYVDYINEPEVMTCLPDAPVPQQINVESENSSLQEFPYQASTDDGAIGSSNFKKGDLRINRFYTFSQNFIQQIQNPSNTSDWTDPMYIESKFLGHKGRGANDLPTFGAGESYHNYISALVEGQPNPFETSAGENISLNEVIANELSKHVGYLRIEAGGKLYFGPQERANITGDSVSDIIRNKFISCVDGEGGVGGQYRTRTGAILGLISNSDYQSGFSSTFNESYNADMWLEDLRDTLEYEGSVSLGMLFMGSNTFTYLFAGWNADITEAQSRRICKSALPNWGWGNWLTDTNVISTSNYIVAANYYPLVFGQGVDAPIQASVDPGQKQDGDGYVGGGGVGSFSFGYGNYAYADNQNVAVYSSRLPGLPRKDSELLVLNNRFYSSTFSDLTGRTFKSSAFHDFGIVYYDHRGRPGPVSRLGNVYVPGYSSNERGVDLHGSSYIDISLQHNPPDWAFDYQIVYSGNTSVSDFVQYTSGGAFVSRDADSTDEPNGIYVSLNYLQGKDNVSYTNEFGAKSPVGSNDMYTYKPGDRLRVISYYENDTDRIWPLNYEFDVVDYRILTDDVENNPLYDPALDGNEVPENKQGTFVVLRTNNNAVGFTYTEVADGISEWNNRTVVELFSPLKDQDSDERPFYEISKAYRVVFSQNQLVHEEDNIRLNEGDVWWRLMAVNMPNNEGGEFEDIVETGGARFRGYFLESKTFSDSVTRADVTFFGKPKFYLPDEGEVRRQSSVTFGERNRYSQNIVKFTNFNPNLLPFKDLSNKYGAINYIESFDEFLLCMQENKISRLPISRNILSDASGNQSLISSNEVVGTPSFYSGSFGTDNNPESVTVVDNDVYFAHKSKSQVLRFNRLEGGIRPISDDGMEEFFDQEFEAAGADARIVTGYDPGNSEMLISITQPTELAQGDSTFISQPIVSALPTDPVEDEQEVVVTDPCEGFEITGLELVNETTAAGQVQQSGTVTITISNPNVENDNQVVFTDNLGNQYEAGSEDYSVYTVPGIPAGTNIVLTVTNGDGCSVDSDPFNITTTEVCDNYVVSAVEASPDSFEAGNDGQIAFAFLNDVPPAFAVQVGLNGSFSEFSYEPYAGSPSDFGFLNSMATYIISGLGPAGGYVVQVGTSEGCLIEATDPVNISQTTDPCDGTELIDIVFEPNAYNATGSQTGVVTITWSGAPGDGLNNIVYANNAVGIASVGTLVDTTFDNGLYTSIFSVTQEQGIDVVAVQGSSISGCLNLSFSATSMEANYATDPCLEFAFSDVVLAVTATGESYSGANDGFLSITTATNGDTFNVIDSNGNIAGTGTTATPAFTVGGLTPGDYTVELITSEGCSDTNDVTYTIEASPESPPVDPGVDTGSSADYDGTGLPAFSDITYDGYEYIGEISGVEDNWLANGFWNIISLTGGGQITYGTSDGDVASVLKYTTNESDYSWRLRTYLPNLLSSIAPYKVVIRAKINAWDNTTFSGTVSYPMISLSSGTQSASSAVHSGLLEQGVWYDLEYDLTTIVSDGQIRIWHQTATNTGSVSNAMEGSGITEVVYAGIAIYAEL